MWLRLVQSARDKEEQNLEAYVKNGQLFYRSLRRIEKDEELLVWYGKDLIDLLLLNSSRAPAKSKGESSAPDMLIVALQRLWTCCGFAFIGTSGKSFYSALLILLLF